ncbi:hypothetical protein Ahy_A06g026377 isoform G [Arachis hypogaea]|uniref:Transmembrane protein n=1 Tax=Arachis hypogaea TaxID=3818 RepID=A0A445CKB0_ARAHY|nr:hypothetical protein Ahy_A06g026377 isoform G [Arachis hypogaea]
MSLSLLIKLRVGGLLHCGVFYFIVERNCGCGHWLCRISKWILIGFRRWSLVPEIGAISSGGRDFDESLIDKLARFSMVLSSIFEDGKIGFTNWDGVGIFIPLQTVDFFWINKPCLGYLSILLTVVVAVTVNISSYCYWFHCEVLSRRVCHPYYIAPVV